MASRLLALVVDAHDPARLSAFWGGVLGREVRDDPRGALLLGSDTQVGLRFVMDGAKPAGPQRVHLHLTSASSADLEHTVAAALELGARHLDVGQHPDEGHVVLADPEGNAFCVIEPGNAFLAGCGFLGELACEGTREVGHFWAAALDWPLVWDRDQETAVQSPYGGTKLAWGGPPVTPKTERNRQRFELVLPEGDLTEGDLAAEVGRLVALGATALTDPTDRGVDLADPDGYEFTLTTGHGRMAPQRGPRRPDVETVELVGGIEKRDLVLADYDTHWPQKYAEHERRIRAALGSAAVQVEHIGSTSVPGLAAKSIIDIQVTVEDITAEEDYLDQLLDSGYELRVREPAHRLVRTHARDVHVHVHEVGAQAATDDLLFRDHLRSDPDDRDLYERTKRALITQDWPDMNAYAEAKTQVIVEIKQRARKSHE